MFKMYLFLLFLFSINHFKLCQSNSEKRVLSNNEESLISNNAEEGLESSENGEDVCMVADEDNVNNELENGKGEKENESSAVDVSNDGETVMNHEEDEKQINEKYGEGDGLEKYEGVFGGYGDDTRSKRVKRVEE